MARKKRKKSEAASAKPLRPALAKVRHFARKDFIAAGLILMAGFAAYSNTFYVPFQFDDSPNIVDNPTIRLEGFSVQWIFRLIEENPSRFFAYFTFALNYYFGGFNVFGYHLVNLLIHVASGMLVFWLLRLTLNLPSLQKRYAAVAFPVALFSGLLFVAHPVQTQAVTYIVQRMASMSAMFYLLAVVLYVKGRLSQDQKQLLYWAGAALGYLLAVFSKENAVILPLFVGLYELFFFRNLALKSEEKKVLIYLAAVFLFLAFLGIALFGKNFLTYVVEGHKTWGFTLWERVLTQSRVVVYYVSLLLYPHPSRLNLDYDFPVSRGILDPPTTLIAVFIIAAIIGCSIWGAKKRPLLSFMVFWYFGNLVVESSIFPIEMVYEHRLYLPAAGPFALFAILVVGAWERVKGTINRKQEAEHGLLRHYPLWLTFSFVIVLLSLWSYQRNTVWGNQITLWEDSVRKSPGKDRPHYNLGLAYYNAKKYEAAVESYKKAILLNPSAQDSYHNLGLVFGALGSYEEAVEANKKAVALKPADPDAFNNLGLAYKATGSYQEAIQAFLEAIRIKPSFPGALNNLGVSYTEMGRVDEAVNVLNKAIELKPNDAEFYNNLGVAFRRAKRFGEAIEAYKTAIRIKPDAPDAYNNLGLAQYAFGNHQEAAKSFSQAIGLKADDGELHYNLGVAYTALGDHAAAVEAYKNSIRITPKAAKARFNLGLSYLLLKKRDLALEQQRELAKVDKERADKLLLLIERGK